MFSQLFLRIFIALTFAVLLGVLLLDNIYIQGTKKDELLNSRGIKQVVLADLRSSAETEKTTAEASTAILDYWSQRFSYQFSLKKLSDLDLYQVNNKKS